VAKTPVGWPAVGPEQTVFKTPFFRASFHLSAPLNWTLEPPSGECRPLSYPLIANDLNAVIGISLPYRSSIIVYYLDVVPSLHPHDCNLSGSQPALGSLRSAISAFSL
jgi:hypothetical protein